MADRLLLLAKNPELRDDQPILERLLHDLGIPPSIEVRRSLRATSEKLGELLMLLQGHDRRYRAGQNLVMVVCEVLSVVQTASRQTQAKQEQRIKEEGALVSHSNFATDQLYQLMDQWRSLIVERARSSDCRASVVSVTMSRLETLSANCAREIEHLQNTMVDYEDERQCAAEKFVEIMMKCQTQIEKQRVAAEELELKVFEDTFNDTNGEQLNFYYNNKALKSLKHRALEWELRRGFYQTAMTLLCVTAQLVAGADEQQELQEMTTVERVNAFGYSMLASMDSFGEALQAVMLEGKDHSFCKDTKGTAAFI
ncbi:hypothetical protein PInf_019925 [Phytophthora infestans]|nr:hypothetical protein PInf_019925 [Phytophthora infestans]